MRFVLSNPTALGTANNSEGEDIMLKSIAAFDVKVFDPEVEVQQSADGRVAVLPSDNGYGIDTTVVGHGGYVDLNYRQGNGLFTGGPSFPVPDDTSFVWTNATYCTWSNHYESDGLDSDGDGLIDEGINGVDDDMANGPDDLNERETMPPYPYSPSWNRGHNSDSRANQQNCPANFCDGELCSRVTCSYGLEGLEN